MISRNTHCVGGSKPNIWHVLICSVLFDFQSHTDKPGTPEGPLEATDVGPTAITLAWKPPKDDGGCRIQKYVLEKRPKGSKKWTKVPGAIGPQDTEATARNLEKGEDYEFRVMAVNEEGESDPLESDGFIRAKHPYGRHCRLS